MGCLTDAVLCYCCAATLRRLLESSARVFTKRLGCGERLHMDCIVLHASTSRLFGEFCGEVFTVVAIGIKMSGSCALEK